MQRAGGKGDGVRAIITAWQDQLPQGSAVRVIAFSGISLEASTFPEDQGDKAAPRRLSREEKPLYDRGQRLRASVETNREEGDARKLEIEVEPLPSGGRQLSAPVEVEGAVVGMVESGHPAAAEGGAARGMAPALLAFFLPLLGVLAISFAPLRRQWQLVAVAAVVFVAGLGGYGAYSLQAL